LIEDIKHELIFIEKRLFITLIVVISIEVDLFGVIIVYGIQLVLIELSIRVAKLASKVIESKSQLLLIQGGQ